MKMIDVKIKFSSYYNDKKETFDGGLYPILLYIKENNLKNVVIRLDYNKKNEMSWEEVDLFFPELSIKELNYQETNDEYRKFIANIKCTPNSGQALVKLLICMAELGNGGHSYGILINDKKFFFDGDGADHISEINDVHLDSEIYKDGYKQIQIYKKGVGEEEKDINENIIITETDIKKMVSESVKMLLKNF